MKYVLLSLLVVIVGAEKLGYPFAESYTKRCKSMEINGREQFTEFIEIKSLKKQYHEERQILNTIICYKGDSTLEVLVSERPEQPINGHRFIWSCEH